MVLSQHLVVAEYVDLGVQLNVNHQNTDTHTNTYGCMDEAIAGDTHSLASIIVPVKYPTAYGYTECRTTETGLSTSMGPR